MLQVIKCKTEIEEALQIFYTDNTAGFPKKNPSYLPALVVWGKFKYY